MSRKPSTAALVSFGHESFRTRRRAPRHPAGETIAAALDRAAGDSLLFRRPGLQPRRTAPKTKWALAPEEGFSEVLGSAVRSQGSKEREIAQAKIVIATEEAINRNHTNRATHNTQLILPALLRVTLALLLALLGIMSPPPTHAQTKPHRIVKTYPINRANAENLQRWVNAGHDTWCRDPKLVAAHTLEQFAPGLADSTYELASQPVIRKFSHGNTASYTYHSLDGQTTYRITLRRPSWLRPAARSVNKAVWIPDRIEILTDSIID